MCKTTKIEYEIGVISFLHFKKKKLSFENLGELPKADWKFCFSMCCVLYILKYGGNPLARVSDATGNQNSIKQINLVLSSFIQT